MAEIEEFAHGRHYGDYAGVVFSATPWPGRAPHRLPVSNLYLRPLFSAVLDRVARPGAGEPMPSLVSDWNTLEGWAAGAAGRVSITPQAAADLATALSRITGADLAPYCAAGALEDCLRCASTVQQFLVSRLAEGADLFIEEE